MTLADYYFEDARLILIPVEQLTPAGLRPEFAALLRERCAWDDARSALFDTAFTLYWTRTTALAAHSCHWAPPRLRHVAVLRTPLAVRPYVQLLNTSAWLLYESDFDPAASHAEFATYLLVHGDRMAQSGEVSSAALGTAAYWFARRDDECAAFAAAAARATRPDAAGFQAVAAALPWLRQLYEDELRPAPAAMAGRSIPGTGLLVPGCMERHPPALVHEWSSVAQRAVAVFHAAWAKPVPAAVSMLCDWLGDDAPPLLVSGRGGRILWDPEVPKRLGAIRAELRHAGGVAVQDIYADLQVIAERTHMFLSALLDPQALPAPAATTEQRGYCYMHRGRRLIAYNLREPGMERLQGPTLPYARAMLGARTVHEWAHLAVDAGWVPQTASAEHAAALLARLAAELDAAIAAAPAAIRARTAPDLEALAAHAPPGAALARILLTRVTDYQANLLACRFLNLSERETYIRHNIRTLRGLYPPAQLWRMLLRYLSEYQYLAFGAVADPAEFFLRSTWFDADFFATGVLDPPRFLTLAATVQRIYSTYAVDERHVCRRRN
jgi:hypothetical protein